MQELIKKFKKLGTKQLLKKVEKLTGEELEAANQVLGARGALKSAEDIPVVGAEEVKPEEAAKPKSVKVKVKKKAAKADNKEAQPAKPKKAKKTLEEVTAEAQEAKENVGKTVDFFGFREAIKRTGVIKSVWIDKRVPIAMYKIKLEDKTVKNKLVTDPTLKIK